MEYKVKVEENKETWFLNENKPKFFIQGAWRPKTARNIE